jgi:GH15 family glucan-1,4-alpha-glucosidase
VPGYNLIEDYGIIGDTLSTALISRDGSIDWLCWPRHDSGALLLRLLDDEVGGFSDIVIKGGRAADRRYLDGTNILETTFATATAKAVLIDFMPVRGRDPVPEEGPDLEAPGMLVRVLTCTEGSIRGRFRTKATFDYARGSSVWNDAGHRCASGPDQSRCRPMQSFLCAVTSAKPSSSFAPATRFSTR